MKPLPKWGMMLITAASMALYIGLAVWGWGGWSAFMAHPARASAVIAIVVISVAQGHRIKIPWDSSSFR